MSEQSYAPGSHPDLPPPPGQRGAIKWVRENLFSSPTNIVLTLLSIYIVWKIVPPMLDWLVFDSVVDANHRNECREQGTGACWAVVRERFTQLMYGFYPTEHRWRVNLAFLMMLAALLPLLWDKMPGRKSLLWFSAAFPVIGFFLLWGGTVGEIVATIIWIAIFILAFRFFSFAGIGILLGVLFVIAALAYFGVPIGINIASWFPDTPVLDPVESSKFGGFMLTVLIGFTGIALSLPLGILLALGRSSNLLIVKSICVGFIEFIRGVPLITLLFIASTLLNYFLPPGTNFDLLLRVMIMVTIFSAAYIAEVIRGGLAALPKGQFEAADATGLTYWESMRLIVLPQALKISIPGIVNTFIGLYKDTTLVLIIGLLDPLGLTQPILADSKWQGLSTELYVFIALFFFISCFAMSRYSLYLERKLDTSHRN